MEQKKKNNHCIHSNTSTSTHRSYPASQPFIHSSSHPVIQTATVWILYLSYKYMNIEHICKYVFVFVFEISCRAKQCAVLYEKCHTNRIGNAVCGSTHIFDYVLTVHGNRNLGEEISSMETLSLANGNWQWYTKRHGMAWHVHGMAWHSTQYHNPKNRNVEHKRTP